MSNLRILQVIPEIKMGGVERATLDMVTALRKIYPTTYVAAKKGELLPMLEDLGATHFPLPLRTKNPFQMIRNGYHLARIIREYNIDVIHARSRAPAWSALLAARLTKTPLITTYHGAYHSTNKLKTFYNSVMARGDRVIAISDFIYKTIEKNHPQALSKVCLIREGIDLEEFDPHTVTSSEIELLKKEWRISPTATLFLVPGRVSRHKGQSIFIDAIRRLNNPNIVGVILGENQDNSSYPAEIRHQAEGLPIRLIPYISKPKVAYAAADFIVSPSLVEEAFGRVTAEAGAMERIIIATNQGATPEICLPEKTGILIEPGNSRALADAMIQVMKMSQQECQTMGQTARQYISDHFSLSRMCRETINLYKELVK